MLGQKRLPNRWWWNSKCLPKLLHLTRVPNEWQLLCHQDPSSTRVHRSFKTWTTWQIKVTREKNQPLITWQSFTSRTVTQDSMVLSEDKETTTHLKKESSVGKTSHSSLLRRNLVGLVRESSSHKTWMPWATFSMGTQRVITRNSGETTPIWMAECEISVVKLA